MKLMRLAMCVAAFALVGGKAISEDMDVKALQAKLAAQEARLNDLQAKMYSASCEDEKVIADGLTSIRKNAVVTLGGEMQYKYQFYKGEVKSAFNATNPGSVEKVWDTRYGRHKVADAKLEMKIDVNEHFDGYLKLDLHDGGRKTASIAQNYWVRWKNVCNTGFGLKVGRDAIAFGGLKGDMSWDSWGHGQEDLASNAIQGFSLASLPPSTPAGPGGVPAAFNAYGEGMFGHGTSYVPNHTTWGDSRTVQLTPYWEAQDGSFKAEVSFFQTIQDRQGYSTRNREVRAINDGLGSVSARLTWKPIEGLTISGSIMNQHAKNRDGVWGYPYGETWTAGAPYRTASNNLATNLAFRYTPCFFDKVTLWAAWTHGWNEGWVKDMDADTLAVGLELAATKALSFYGMGDFIRVKNDNGVIWHKANGWATDFGLKYKLPYGVTFKAGWRHEQIDYKARGGFKHTKVKADGVFGAIDFVF